MLTRAMVSGRGHPRFRTSLRWWIAERTVLGLFCLAFGSLVALSAAIAVGLTLTLDSPRGLGARMGDVHALTNLTLHSLRACVGTDNIDPQEGNSAQETLSTLASAVGAIVPATLVGVVFIKMFSVRPFVWRNRVSVSYAHQADARNFAEQHVGSDHRILAVRFYNRMENLAVIDLSARVYLWYLRPSPHDGTPVFYKQQLHVLDQHGQLAQERTWFIMDRGAPLTVWIPVEAAVPDVPIREIQGTRLDGAHSVRMLVRLTAKAAGLGTEVFGERWFDLDGNDFELGRFAPVKPDVDADIRDWEGWPAFDSLLGVGERAGNLPQPVEAVASDRTGRPVTLRKPPRPARARGRFTEGQALRPPRPRAPGAEL
ncbi:hypothetical protein [Streptomyces sp. NPDC088348]|uniref:hypothetical protein n=1 Tax=Streptomyces sp. NPDC088348 TaxID=3365853 RepID=UPI0038266E4B